MERNEGMLDWNIVILDIYRTHFTILYRIFCTPMISISTRTIEGTVLTSWKISMTVRSEEDMGIGSLFILEAFTISSLCLENSVKTAHHVFMKGGWWIHSLGTGKSWKVTETVNIGLILDSSCTQLQHILDIFRCIRVTQMVLSKLRLQFDNTVIWFSKATICVLQLSHWSWTRYNDKAL